MLQWDLVARRTPYYAALLADLKQIALHGPSPHASGFNGNHALIRTEAADLCRDLHSSFASHLPPLQLDSSSTSTAAAVAASPFTTTNLALSPVLGTVDSSSQLSVRCFSRRLCSGVDLLLSSLLANKRPPAPNHPDGVSVLVAKKVVRPHVVGPPTPRSAAGSSATSSSLPSAAPPLERQDSVTFDELSTASGANHNGSLGSPDADFGRRLRTAFFRRHPTLQRCADFCVDAAVANAKAAVIATHCAATHQLGSATSAVRSQARAAAARDAAYQIEEAVTSAMHALMPKHPLLLPEPVAATALHLTLDLALGAGLSAVKDAVAADLASQVQRHMSKKQPIESPPGLASAAGVATASSLEGKVAATANSTAVEPVSSHSDGSTATLKAKHVQEDSFLPPTAADVETAMSALLAAAKDTSRLPPAAAGVASATAAAVTALPEEMKISSSTSTRKEAQMEVAASSARLLEARATAACDDRELLTHLPVLWRHCCPRTKHHGPTAATIAALAPCLTEAVVLGGSCNEARVTFFIQLIDARLLSLASLEQCLLSILLRPVTKVPGAGEDQASPSQRTYAHARAFASGLVAFVTERQQSTTMTLDSAVTPLHCHRLKAYLSEKFSN